MMQKQAKYSDGSCSNVIPMQACGVCLSIWLCPVNRGPPVIYVSGTYQWQ